MFEELQSSHSRKNNWSKGTEAENQKVYLTLIIRRLEAAFPDVDLLTFTW